MVRTLFLNGTVGSGKTTTLEALSGLLTTAHATIDMDQITCLSPPPAGDRFCEAVGLANLSSLCANYTSAGAKLIIVAGVIEEMRIAEAYAEAVGERYPNGFSVLRLRCSKEEGERRLKARHAEDPQGLDWHLRRHGELDEILDTVDIGVTVDTDGKQPEEVARQVMAMTSLTHTS